MERKNNPCTDLLQDHRVPGDQGSQISKQSPSKGGEIVSPTHWTPLLQVIFLILITVRG